MGDCRMPLRGKDHKVIIEKLLGGFVADVSEYSLGFKTHSAIDEPFMYVDVTISDQSRVIQNMMAGDPGDYSIVIGHRAANDQMIAGRFHVASVLTQTQTAPKKSQAVTFRCKGQEHLLNEQTKFAESEFWWAGAPTTTIVKKILDWTMKISPKGNAESNDKAEVAIPRQHPIQVIGWLNSIATSPTGDHGNFAFYQKFSGGKAEYYYDDVPLLLTGGASWIFKENETNMSKTAAGCRVIDEIYVGGGNESPILSKRATAFQNASTATQQGFGRRSFMEQKYIRKEVRAKRKEASDPTYIGGPPMTEVQKYIKEVYQQDSQGRVLYEPVCDDTTLRPEQMQFHEAWIEGRGLSARILSKMVEIKSYATPEIGPGDVVWLLVPEYIPSPGRGLDTTQGGPYFVYAVDHLCDRNGDMTTNLLLTKDGTT